MAAGEIRKQIYLSECEWKTHPGISHLVIFADRQLGSDEYVSDPAHPVPYTEDVHFNRTREYMTDDQRFASRRPDVLTFQTDVLNEDLTLAGVVTADLKVSISSTDADFVVKVIDVFPDDFKYPGDIDQPNRAQVDPIRWVAIKCWSEVK